MARDSKGRFVPQDPAVPAARERQRWEERVITLLEHLAYNTAQTHLTCDEYLRQRVYKERPHADHPAAD